MSDLFPINQIPPGLCICNLAAVATGSHAPIQQPRVLPGVQAQQRLQLDTARGQVPCALAVSVDLVLEVGLGGAIATDGVHVCRLRAPVGSGVRRASEVGREDAEVTGAGFDEPDEAGAEHGGGGDDEFAAEGLDGGEGGLELVAEGVGHGCAGGRYALEEEVVVVCHGGVVEGGCLAGLAGG